MKFFRTMWDRFQKGYRRFMMGRYGTDKLNLALLIVSVVAGMLSIVIPGIVLKVIFMVISYGIMIWAIFRMMSRKTYQRYLENRKFLQLIEQIKDRQHRYYNCPRCRQQIRVPRGKGKISITCPKCKEKFIKKT